jgi:putative SOS response-associated peptidase YedK
VLWHIQHSKFWKDDFLTGRCVLPGDAVYEWQEAEKGKKKPKYEFTIPGQQPFGMAGVWKLWRNLKTNHWEKTFAVLTGEPNELMAPSHDRMTTFLEPRDYEEHLAPADRPPIHLLRILSTSKNESAACRRNADHRFDSNYFYLSPHRLTRWRSNGLLLHTKNALFATQSNVIKDQSAVSSDL